MSPEKKIFRFKIFEEREFEISLEDESYERACNRVSHMEETLLKEHKISHFSIKFDKE